MENLFNLWVKRNPQWEKRYQAPIMDVFTDYGRGVNRYQVARARVFGAGYEAFIIAFFIGLYFDKTKPLVEDKACVKTYGQPIQYWGNLEERLGRTAYAEIREYIFAALVAKTDIDLLALDRGEISPRAVVDQLMDKMEQYANFGFSYMCEKMEDDQNYFFQEMSFLNLFMSFLKKDKKDDEQLESL